jgi:hypothetical protein
MMNSLNDVCADLSIDADKSKKFLEEVHKLHKNLMGGNSARKKDDGNSVVLKDPPVIKKKSSKSKETSNNQDVEEAETDPSIKTVNLWINDVGTVSRPVEATIEKEKRSCSKRKQQPTVPVTLNDPPQSSSKSVNKSNRLKPQSEKRSTKKKSTKKK